LHSFLPFALMLLFVAAASHAKDSVFKFANGKTATPTCSFSLSTKRMAVPRPSLPKSEVSKSALGPRRSHLPEAIDQKIFADGTPYAVP